MFVYRRSNFVFTLFTVFTAIIEHVCPNYTVFQKKFPPLNSVQFCQMLTDFQNFCTVETFMKFATKPIWPPHLRHVATLPWEIKNANFLQIFSTHGRKCKQIAFYRLYLCYSSTNFDIFSVQNSEFFRILITNTIFHVTVLLLVYFCDQFVAPEICHSRRHSSVCQQSTLHSVTRTRFW